MNTYYLENGTVVGRAWSVMTCWLSKDVDTKEHSPHTHDPEYAMYGPYMCPGMPKQKLYDTPPRKPINKV